MSYNLALGGKGYERHNLDTKIVDFTQARNRLYGGNSLEALTNAKAVVSDMHGTNVDKAEWARAEKYAMDNQHVIKSAAEQLGVGIEDMVKSIKEGSKAEKGSAEFEKYVDYVDVLVIKSIEDGLEFNLFDDVEGTVKQIKDSGAQYHVFSSGGVPAQKKVFENNLGDKIDGYHSPKQGNIGMKYDAQTYKNISKNMGVDLKDIIYVADDKKETEAAAKAGIGKVYFIDRSGKDNGKQENGYTIIDSYEKILEGELDGMLVDAEGNAISLEEAQEALEGEGEAMEAEAEGSAEAA